MGVAMTLKEFLEGQNVTYEVIPHVHTATAMRTAEAAHVPGDQVAKSVLLGDEESYLLAVIPSTYRLELARLNQMMARHFELLAEEEIEAAFSDCERGAIPPVGQAYGIETLLESDLVKQAVVYFEAGDHEHLIKMSGADFRTLMGDVHRGHVSHHL